MFPQLPFALSPSMRMKMRTEPRRARHEGERIPCVCTSARYAIGNANASRARRGRCQPTRRRDSPTTARTRLLGSRHRPRSRFRASAPGSSWRLRRRAHAPLATRPVSRGAIDVRIEGSAQPWLGRLVMGTRAETDHGGRGCSSVPRPQAANRPRPPHSLASGGRQSGQRGPPADLGAADTARPSGHGVSQTPRAEFEPRRAAGNPRTRCH
jgi:hypothetical protein